MSLFETNANSELIRYTNNAAGDLLSLTDGKNQTTKWNYNEYGLLTNKVDQAGSEILRYQYDADTQLTNRWSVAKGNTKYAYDPVGSLTNIDYPASTDVSLAYDSLNRLTNLVDVSGTLPILRPLKSLMQLIRRWEDAAVPELAQFSTIDRALLIRRSTELFRMNHALLANAPLFLCCIGGVVGWGGLPLALGSLGLKVGEIQVALVCSTIGSALGGFIGGSIGKQALFRWIRPNVRAIIRSGNHTTRSEVP